MALASSSSSSSSASAAGGEFAASTTLRAYAPDLVIEPIHMDIDLTVDVKGRSVEGSVSHTVIGRAPETKVRSFELNAMSFLNVEVRGDDVEDYSYDGEKITVVFKTPLSQGEKRIVAIHYRVESPVGGLVFNVNSEAYPNTSEFVISDHETERARYWLPCMDVPAIRTTLSWSLTADKKYEVVANGLLEGDPKLNAAKGTKTWVWRLEFPCPSYLVCFGVGDFVTADDGDYKGRAIRYIGTRDNMTAEGLKRTFAATPQMLPWLEAKVGTKFPFPKYFQIIGARVGGAMENISLVTWDDVFYMNDDVASSEWQYIVDMVNIHEMAHSYFGDALVIRHFEHAWLKESWATYIESVWLQDSESEDAFRYEMWCNARQYMSEVEGAYVRPIVTQRYDTSWAMFDRHLYPGGCWRIHMLRALMGDSAFWAGVAAYVSKNMGKSVETNHFREALEASSGRNLTRFFDEWLYSRGYPKLKGTYKWTAEKSTAEVSFRQTQMSSKASIGAFTIVLDVEIIDTTGTSHRQEVTWDNGDSSRKATAVFQLPKGVKPKVVIVDPDMKVLFDLDFNPGEELLGSALTNAPDVVTRIRAGRELIKIGTRSALAKVRAAAAAEPYWGVRVELASSLGSSKTMGAIELLAGMIEAETAPQATRLVINAAGGIRHPSIRKALLAVIKRGDLPYRALGSALTVLGGQLNEEDLPLLIHEATNPSKPAGGFVQAGALRGLGRSRSADAMKTLKALVAPGGVAPEARRAAVSSLAEVTCWQGDLAKRGMCSVMVDLLRDDDENVGKSAVSALITLGGRGHSAHVAAFKARLPHQTHVWLEKQLKSLRDSGDGSSVAGMKKDVSDLTEKVRSLTASLEELKSKGPSKPQDKRSPPAKSSSVDAVAERTFLMIKPDGVERGLVGEVVKRFESRGYTLVAMKFVKPSLEHAQKHYADLSTKPFFGDLTKFLSSGPVVAMVWEGERVVSIGRSMIGATDPAASLPGSIRGDLSVDIGRNMIHGSDSVASAQAEISLWFKESELSS